MKKIYLILIAAVILPLIAIANDKAIIDMVDDLRSKVKDNNTYQTEVDTVYEAMKRNVPVEVQVPEIKLFANDQKRVMESFSLPTKDTLINNDNETCLDPEQLGDYRVYVFISESVPAVTLKNYMTDALKFKDVLLVMRGVIGSADFIKPTQDFMTRLTCNKRLDELKAGDNCTVSRLDINPQLFKMFNIEKAPAVVFSKLTYYELMLRVNLGQPINDNEYYILRGDTSLEYAFERFGKAGADVNEYLKTLRGSYGG